MFFSLPNRWSPAYYNNYAADFSAAITYNIRHFSAGPETGIGKYFDKAKSYILHQFLKKCYRLPWRSIMRKVFYTLPP